MGSLEDGRDNGPGIRVPPPLYFAAGGIAAWALERLAPLPFVPEPASTVLAGLAVGASAYFAFPSLVSFRRAGTGILPHQPATAVVVTGPYRLTRNPMYLALALLYAGLASLFGLTWAFLLLPVVLAAVTKLVIRREEAYLEAKFGDGYREYKRRVRRWL